MAGRAASSRRWLVPPELRGRVSGRDRVALRRVGGGEDARRVPCQHECDGHGAERQIRGGDSYIELASDSASELR